MKSDLQGVIDEQQKCEAEDDTMVEVKMM